MVLGGKVVAAVNPEVELNVFDEDIDGDDCICICFCEDDEDDGDDNEESLAATLIKEGTGNLNPDGDGEEEEEEDEEGLVDPQEELKSQCSQKAECTSLKAKLEDCNARVESRSKTAETCIEELIDFMHCVDHCASHTLFSKLK